MIILNPSDKGANIIGLWLGAGVKIDFLKGEEKDFPEEIGQKLLVHFGFLQKMSSASLPLVEREEGETETIIEKVKCEVCGKEMKPRALPLHKGRFHKLIT